MNVNTPVSSHSSSGVQKRIRSFLRPIFAVTCGIIAGVLVINSLQHGFQYRYEKEYSFDLWGPFVWGDHWFLRTLASLASTYLSSYIAGMIARKNGEIVGALSSAPTAMLWAIFSYLNWVGEFEISGRSYESELSLMYKVAAAFISLASGVCGIHAGVAGANMGIQLGTHFDTRRFSLLGVKWYHYFWTYFPIHFVLAQTAWILLYAGDWFKASWSAGDSLIGIIPSLFLMAIYGTLYLTVQGFWKAYLILSGIEHISKLKDRIKSVSKFGCGWPLLAILAQSGIAVLHKFALKIVEWFN
jgi:hypothetical protein